MLHLFFFSFFYSRPDCALSQALKPLFFFHHLKLSHLSHQALISPISLINSHLSSFHLPAKPKPSPSLAPAVVIASTMLSQALKPLIFFFIISSSHLPAKSSPSQPSPLPAHASAHARHRRQPTLGQCSLFFSSEFFNCCFVLIFLCLVLFCGEKWCCPYVVLGKIKKTFVLE